MITQAAILCGGRGTRLGALAADRPKPLIPIGDAPFLELLLFEIARHGVTDILLLAGFEARQIGAFASATSLRRRFGLRIEVSIEPQPSGTGGAVWHARDRLHDEFFLLNGDTWFDINLLSLGVQLDGRPAAIGALALRRLADASRFGSVRLAGEVIAAFSERPSAAGPGLVSGGVYAMRRALVDELGADCSLERDVLPRLAAGGRLLGRAHDGYFIDIGVPADLARAREELPRRRRRPGVFLDAAMLRPDETGRDTWAAIRRLNDAGFLVFAIDTRDPLSVGALRARLAESGAHLDDTGVAIDRIADAWPLDRERIFAVPDVADERAAGIPVHRVSPEDLADLAEIAR